MLRTRAVASAAALVLLAGCTPGSGASSGPTGGASGVSTGSATTDASPATPLASVPIVVGSVAPPRSPSAAPTKPFPTPTATDAAQTLLAAHGLGGRSAKEVIEQLEASREARPLPLQAVVKPGVLEVSDGTTTGQLPLPDDMFYVAIAPFTSGNPECRYHNLAEDVAQLAGKKVHVVINDANNSPLVDADVTLNPNGYAGFWLPRGRKGLITVMMDGLVGQTDYNTLAAGPTCRSQIHLK